MCNETICRRSESQDAVFFEARDGLNDMRTPYGDQDAAKTKNGTGMWRDQDYGRAIGVFVEP